MVIGQGFCNQEILKMHVIDLANGSDVILGLKAKKFGLGLDVTGLVNMSRPMSIP